MTLSSCRNRSAALIGLIFGMVAAQSCSTPRPYTGGQEGSNVGAVGGATSMAGQAGSKVSTQGSGGSPADAGIPDVPASTGGVSQDGAVAGNQETGSSTGGSHGSGG